MASVPVANNPAIVTAADTNSNELVFSVPNPAGLNVNIAYIKVTAGTFQFRVGAAPDVNSPSYGTTDIIPPISFVPGDAGKASNIFFKAGSASNTFQIAF